jgi:predicted dehydrogenase
MVWYNYRRVPAVTLAKQLIDDGKLGRIFHYRAKFLQDWTISRRPAAGRRGPLAPRRQGRRQRRHRRSAGALHRHRDVAERRASTKSPP